ncbi:hypothetical protein RCH22_001177 [Cryobacterium psychrotolerans]|nr:hypothetical protein [Cryobacterium psychrotolerans]
MSLSGGARGSGNARGVLSPPPDGGNVQSTTLGSKHPVTVTPATYGATAGPASVMKNFFPVADRNKPT